jgi:mannose-6-phosphate isomerase
MQQIFTHIKQQLTMQGFTITQHDFERPWGGFFVIDPSQSTRFIELYFPKEQ